MTAKKNNGVEIAEGAEGAEAQTLDQKNAGAGRKRRGRGLEAPAAPAERAWRRRNSLTTSDGLLREHARLIAAMFAGKIGLERGETLSRAMARQGVMLHTAEERAILIDLRREAQLLRKFKDMTRVSQPAQLLNAEEK